MRIANSALIATMEGPAASRVDAKTVEKALCELKEVHELREGALLRECAQLAEEVL